MKIGITERGDASRDFSWLNSLDKVDGAILITKNVTDKFIDTVLENEDKIIVHATITGYGATKVEPNVMTAKESLEQLKKLMKKGFPAERIVLRVDPIIPTEKGILLAERVIRDGYALGLRRVRISVIDMYQHVKTRFRAEKLPLPYGEDFSASEEQFRLVDGLVSALQYRFHDLSIESCGETKLKNPEPLGCISEKDLAILGIPFPQNSQALAPTGYQRACCHCLSCKKELLANNHRCENGCLYCYWKD